MMNKEHLKSIKGIKMKIDNEDVATGFLLAVVAIVTTVFIFSMIDAL